MIHLISKYFIKYAFSQKHPQMQQKSPGSYFAPAVIMTYIYGIHVKI